MLESDRPWYELSAGDGHSQPAWRDPWVYRSDDGYHMMITARCHRSLASSGIIARARSQDLRRWEVEAPLTNASDFAELEVPQLIEIVAAPC